MRNQAEAHLSALIESTEDLIWSVGRDYGLLSFNQAFQRHVERNLGASAAIGKRPQDLLPPEKAALWPSLFERALAQGPFRAELPFAAGRTLELSLNPIVVDGETTGVSVFGKDITERKAAELALLEAEKKYRDIFDEALEGIFQTSLEGKTISVNRALARMLGYDSPDELLSMVEDAAQDVWADPVERSSAVRQLEAHGAIRGVECRFKRKDGSIIWVSISSRLVYDAQGQPLFLEGFIEDITERKRVATAQAESEARFRTFFEENSSVMLLVEPSSGEIVAANQAASAFYGYPLDRLVGMHTSQINTPPPEQLARDRLQALSKERSLFAYRHRLASGEERDVELHSSPFVLEGRPLLYAIIHDVTGRNLATRGLVESEARFRTFFEESGSVMLLVEPSSGEIVAANRAASAFLGYPLERLVGMNISQIDTLPPEVLAHDRQQALRKERSFFAYRCRLASGEERDIEVYSSPFVVGGRPLLHGIIHDVTDRKRAQDKLRESEESLLESQSIAGLGSYDLDIPAAIWTSTKVLDAIFGIGPDYDRTVQGWMALLHPGDRAATGVYFAQEVVGKGQPFDREYRIIRQTDRAERWVHGLGRLDFDAHGQPVRMRGTIKDITESKQAETRLRESEERYRATFDQAALGIAHASFDGTLLRCNTRFAEIIGYPPEEVPGLTVQQITEPKYLPENIAIFQQIFTGAAETVSFDKRYIRKDGSFTWVKMSVSAQRDSEGRALHLIGFAEDINARKAAEERLAEAQEALRTSENHYRTVFQTSVDGICISRMDDGTYVDANRAFLAIMGFERDEIIGRTSVELNFWTDPEDRRNLVEALRLHSSFRDFKTRYRRKNGEIIWVLISASATEIDGAACILSVVRDISDAVAAQERLAAVQEELRASEERYFTAFQASPNAVNIFRLDDGVYLDVNATFLDTMGFQREEVIGHTSRELNIWVDPRDLQDMVEALRRNLVFRGEVQLRSKIDKRFWGLMSASVFEHHGVSCVLSVTADISDAKAAAERLAAAQEALRASEERYRTAFQTSLDAISINRLDDGMYIECNLAFLKIMGYERHEVLGRTSLELGTWADRRDQQRFVEMLRENSSCRDLEAQFKRKDGDVFWVLMSASMIELEGVPCVLSIFRDISEAKGAETEIRNLAFYDPLTGLPNRRLLLERLRQILAVSARSRRKQALLFVDLDNFKTMNDALGHQMGDLLLQDVARRILTCVREGDTVGRLGGDEFVAMLEDLGEVPEEAAAQAQAVAEKILAAVSQAYLLAGRECHSTASIGITIFGDQRESTSEVLQQADIAMYQAKTAGRNTMSFFSPALQAAVNARAAMEEDLREAIRTNQFILYFQPQVDSGQLIGAEALLRWEHPTRGVMAPGGFIPLAEETGLILPLGNWVLETACAQIATWAARKEIAPFTVAVNISARQFCQPEFVEQVLTAIDRAGADPKRLKLELTESMLVENIEDVIAKMSDLRSHGLKFSLDDFGTGYSSLTYLKRLPLDQLKIDRSFVRDILVDAGSGAIARTIVSLGQAMGLSVVAEGVETDEQRDFLTRLGCHSFQGYLFGRPLPLKDFERLWLGSAECAAPIPSS